MARPRTYATEGIVLKQMPLGEADRVLTIYTPDLGKLRAVARSVRRSRSRMAGHLEPLTRTRVSISEGRSLDHIGEAETLQSYRPLREDLELVSKAMYLADLVDSFTVDRSPSAALFDLLAGSLARLETARNADQVLRYFEVRLLHTSGFGPELRECVECRAALEPATHLFCPIRRRHPLRRMRPLRAGFAWCRSPSAQSRCCASSSASRPTHVDALEVPTSSPRARRPGPSAATRPTYLERDLKSARFMNLVAAK